MIQLLRRSLCCALLLGLLVPAVPAVPAGGAGGAGLAAALDSIQADKIKSDIFFLASDELGGRDTPSVGQRIAARFIRARMMRLGVPPGTPDGYLFNYKLVRRELDLAESKAQAVKSGRSVGFYLGTDYTLHPSAIAHSNASGNVVYCAEADEKQLAALDLAGKWALCEDSGMSGPERRTAVKQAGAIGVLLAPGTKTNAERMDKRIRDYFANIKSPGVRFPENRDEERDVYPYLMISAATKARLLELSGPLADPTKGPAVGTDLGVVFSESRKELSQDGLVDVENVCAFWPGRDPELSKDVIIVSAHYDHVGTNAAGEVFNGADDNGSGTTGLLQLAEALTVNGPLRRSVMLIWVSGEEKGLFGSRAWCAAPSLPAGHRAVCNINIDMIGRNAPDLLLITPTKARAKDYNGLTRLAESLCAQEGFPELGNADQYWMRSDQVNFASYLKIPVTFLFSDVHEDYHRSTDDPEKIDYDKIRRVTRLVLRMLDGLQADELKL